MEMVIAMLCSKERGGGGGGEYPETNSRGREEKEEAQRTYGVDAET